MIEIPNYKIEKELGTGGMSTVYLATHEILGRQVALKIMSPSFLKDGSFKECFINEGRIISKLNHPHVIHIYDIGVSNDACYMAVELLEVGTLREKIDAGNLSIQDKQKIITQIASALNAAHAQNFIHRDVKPGNILFKKNGDAVLTDFGISKIQDTEGEYTTLGFAAGTPSYMPPEFSLEQELDHRADIYSLGVVFYEMLTGEKPYKAKTAAAISYAHVNAPIPQLEPSLAHYQNVIDRALAKKREDRFDSVLDFSSAIEMADTSTAPTVIAKREDFFPQVKEKLEKESQPLLDTDKDLSQAEPQSRPQLKKEKSTPWGIIGGGAVLLFAIGLAIFFLPPSPDKVIKIKNITEPKPINTSQVTPINIPPVAVEPPVRLPVPTTSTTLNNKPDDSTALDMPDGKPQDMATPIIPVVATDIEAKPKSKPKTKPDVLTQEQKIVVNSLLENCLLRASTTVKESIRISKNKSIINDIKKLKMNSGRTKFITDTQRLIQVSQQRIDDNIARYYKNLSKLKAYKVAHVREQLADIRKEQTKRISKGVIDIMLKHLNKLINEDLSVESSKKDLGDYAKIVASTL